MNIFNLHIGKVSDRICVSLLAFGCLLTSCDDAIYDYEGDCEPHYMVSFCYDYNMKWADAFPHEVESVTLHMIDADGNVVWQGHDSGEALSLPGYAMPVDVAPGRYTLLAWAGDNPQLSFAMGESRGATDLTARLNRRYDMTGAAYSDTNLSRLYHGIVYDVEFPDAEGEHCVTVPLTKDTNNIKVVLQQTSGEPLALKDLEIVITDDNGMMEWDNSLRADEVITYRPWHVTPIVADISPDDAQAGDIAEAAPSVQYSGVMAEFTTARLMEQHRNSARLTVRNLATGKNIFNVRLIDFLLMVKGEINRELGEQEYLDRQDTYDLVFFLDSDHKWLDAVIFINSWRVVLQNVGLN